MSYILATSLGVDVLERLGVIYFLERIFTGLNKVVVCIRKYILRTSIGVYKIRVMFIIKFHPSRET